MVNILPLVVASIALITSALSLYSSFRLKDKEFKNDYYKKVLDNRLKALEAAEVIMYLFKSRSVSKADGKMHHKLLADLDRKETFYVALEDVLRYSIWYDVSLNEELKKFCGLIAKIINDTESITDRFELSEIAQEKFTEIQAQIHCIAHLSAESLLYLDDIKSFLERKKVYYLKVKGKPVTSIRK